MKVYLVKSSALVLIFSVLLAFPSCSNFNEPVKGFFEHYTDNAAIEIKQMNDPYEIDASGIMCYGSDSDKSIDLLLRNPQLYDIDFDYSYDLTELSEVFAAPFVPLTIIQDPKDKSRARLTFNKEFLEAVDVGDFTVRDPITNIPIIKKNISGNITLTEGETGRPFESFHIELSANSKPPRFRYSMFQRKGTRETAGTCFILCMNIQKLAGTIHEKDTHDLYIGKDHWTFSGNISSDADLVADARNSYTLTTSEPTTLYSLDGGAKVFENPDSLTYTSLYYIIDDKSPENFQGNLEYLIKLVDDSGLYSSTLVTNKAEQLREPSVQNNEGTVINSGTTCPADDTTGYFELVLTHSRGTFHFDENGEPIDGAYLKAMPQIVYAVTKSGLPYAQGTARAPVKINLSPDTNTYSVKAYAIENGYVDSKEIDSVTGIKVTRSTNYYVNQNGLSKEEGANGSPLHPYKNMKQCIDDINADTENEESPFNIYMQTDIEADFTGDTYLSLNTSKKIKIQGYNGRKTLDLKRSAASRGRGISLINGELTLKDIKITGGVLEDTNSGAGIEYKGGSLNIEGQVIIDGNYSCLGNEITTPDNLFISSSESGPYKLKITGSINNSKIGIKYSGVNNITVDNPCIFTDGYKTNNPSLHPALVFHYDGDEAAISQLENGEASLAKSGGGITEGINEDMTLSLDKSTIVTATSETITLTVKSGETEVTPDSYSYKLKYYSDDVKSGWSATNNKIKFENVPKGKYKLYATVTIGEMQYTGSFNITINTQP